MKNQANKHQSTQTHQKLTKSSIINLKELVNQAKKHQSTQTHQKLTKSSIINLKELVFSSLLAAFFKLLLIPSYRSTDFEVHRHWLALTHSLYLPHWYSDETSPWTLDYPPFFAYFEHFLSFFAKLIDPTIVDLHKGLNYNSISVIIFQRLTVIASDITLIYGVYRLTRNLGMRQRIMIWVLVIWSPGLMVVDHVHFQYNGFLIGILLISLLALEDGKDLFGGLFLRFYYVLSTSLPWLHQFILCICCGIIAGEGCLEGLGGWS